MSTIVRQSLQCAALLIFAYAAQAAPTAAPPKGQLLSDEQDKDQAIEQTVGAMEGLDPVKAAKLKIQLAIADFLVAHGSLPESLDALVPLYFKEVPLNPNTGKPFKYVRHGQKYELLDENPAPNSAK